ncbi:hypothetical protein GCM10014715_23580 [Streptomyces spiralis]|uniref:Uncharacterized protein n=1 Tax=Streptomyces spiralis TaxID=66376 RepID=A0A918ZUP6_9ACTN|nr:hypothetical protein [Streptomyces spiralis]GHE69055.1 hypothetical protein GCM10014715_23580 [Streptomyces spiralis]
MRSGYGAETEDGRRLVGPDEQALTGLIDGLGQGPFVVLGPDDPGQRWWVSVTRTWDGFLFERGALNTGLVEKTPSRPWPAGIAAGLPAWVSNR